MSAAAELLLAALREGGGQCRIDRLGALLCEATGEPFALYDAKAELERNGHHVERGRHGRLVLSLDAELWFGGVG